MLIRRLDTAGQRVCKSASLYIRQVVNTRLVYVNKFKPFRKRRVVSEKQEREREKERKKKHTRKKVSKRASHRLQTKHTTTTYI